MKDITLIYETVESRPIVPGYLMDEYRGTHYAMHYENGRLWLCTVIPTDKPDEFAIVDYIALTRRKVDLMELFVMLREMSALTFITEYLIYETDIEMFD